MHVHMYICTWTQIQAHIGFSCGPLPGHMDADTGTYMRVYACIYTAMAPCLRDRDPRDVSPHGLPRLGVLGAV